MRNQWIGQTERTFSWLDPWLDHDTHVCGSTTLHYVTDHLPSPAHAPGTACQPAFVTRHCPQEHSQHCWKLTCLNDGCGAGAFELAPEKCTIYDMIWWHMEEDLQEIRASDVMLLEVTYCIVLCTVYSSAVSTILYSHSVLYSITYRQQLSRLIVTHCRCSCQLLQSPLDMSPCDLRTRCRSWHWMSCSLTVGHRYRTTSTVSCCQVYHMSTWSRHCPVASVSCRQPNDCTDTHMH